MPAGKKGFALPDGPSIAVLPFVNMSGDPEQEYFSDGLTENIIAGLSVHGTLLVIARNSTFVYKGKSADIQEVGRKLGAQYVVEGSVQKTRDRVRITAQLIDANTGHHVWSDRYDRELRDIFSLQDEITIKIMRAVGMKLVTGEQYGYELISPSGNLEVFMKLLKGREYIFRSNKEGNILARQEFKEALVLDPEHAALYSLLAYAHLLDLLLQSSESPEASFSKASENVNRALELDNESWIAHLSLSYLYLLRNEHDKSIAGAERAIALNPNAADAYSQLGHALVFSGRAEEGIKLLEKAMRLNPIPPDFYLNRLGYAYRFLGQYEDAIEAHKEVLRRSPNNLFAHVWLIAAYSALDREGEARRQAEELLRLDPAFSAAQIGRFYAMKVKAEIERFVDDLRKAGLQ